MSDLLDAVGAVRGARDDLQAAFDYYDGEVGEVFGSDRLRRQLEAAGSDYQINFARTPVSAVLNRLEIASVQSPEAGIQELVDDVWDHNDLTLESQDYHEWGLVFGESYALVWPSVEDGKVDVIYQDPRTTQVLYHDDNPRVPRFGAKLWEEGTGNARRFRLNLYYADRVEKWITKAEGLTGDKDGDWVEHIDTYREAEAGEPLPGPNDTLIVAVGGEIVPQWPIPNPYGQVPVFHFRTSRPHGRPEHRDAYGPQNLISKISHAHPEVIDFTAGPQRVWIQGDQSGGESVDFDEGMADETGDEPRLSSKPGGLWKLPSGTVHQFDPAKPDSFLEPFREYVQAMAAVTDTPVHKFKGMTGAPSGEALRAAEAPLVAKVIKRQRSFEATWRKLLRFACMVKLVDQVGAEHIDDVTDDQLHDPVDSEVWSNGPPTITLTWKPAESIDDKDKASAIKSLREAQAISIRRAVERAQPNLSEDEVTAEVTAILQDAGMLFPDPNSGQAEDLTAFGGRQEADGADAAAPGGVAT